MLRLSARILRDRSQSVSPLQAQRSAIRDFLSKKGAVLAVKDVHENPHAAPGTALYERCGLTGPVSAPSSSLGKGARPSLT